MLELRRASLFFIVCIGIVLQCCLAADSGDQAVCAAESGKDCKSCLQHAQCYYCTSTKNCTFYPWKSLIPKSDVCSMGDIRWGTCWVNFVALIVSILVIVLVIITSVACWCHFYCKKRRIRSVERDERRFAAEREAREAAAAERRAERQVRTDAIREKYGIGGQSKTGPGRGGKKNYQRMP